MFYSFSQYQYCSVCAMCYDKLNITSLYFKSSMYTECAACVLLLLLVVVYFPAKPPSPPSLTASIDRTSYLHGIKGLFK